MTPRRLGYEYRVGQSTAAKIIEDTISVMLKRLVPKYLSMPKSPEEWSEIIRGFKSTWQFPNCIGALDGKHCHIYPPRNSGSLYYNYKEGFSVVLLALVDAEYKFIGIDVGANGRCSDAGIWETSPLRKVFVEKKAKLPDLQALPESNHVTPYVILADSGFALEDFVMRPYPEKNMTPKQRIFNYRY